MNLSERSEFEARLKRELPGAAGLPERVWRAIVGWACQPLIITGELGSRIRAYGFDLSDGRHHLRYRSTLPAADFKPAVFQRDDRCFVTDRSNASGHVFELLIHRDNSYRDCGQLSRPNPMFSECTDSLIFVSAFRNLPITRYSIRDHSFLPALLNMGADTSFLFGAGRYLVSCWWDEEGFLLERIRVLDLSTGVTRDEALDFPQSEGPIDMICGEPQSSLLTLQCRSELIEIDLALWFRSPHSSSPKRHMPFAVLKTNGGLMVRHQSVYYETAFTPTELCLVEYMKTFGLQAIVVATLPQSKSPIDHFDRVQTDGRHLYWEKFGVGLWICDPLSRATLFLPLEDCERHIGIYWTL